MAQLTGVATQSHYLPTPSQLTHEQIGRKGVSDWQPVDRVASLPEGGGDETEMERLVGPMRRLKASFAHFDLPDRGTEASIGLPKEQVRKSISLIGELLQKPGSAERAQQGIKVRRMLLTLHRVQGWLQLYSNQYHSMKSER